MKSHNAVIGHRLLLGPVARGDLKSETPQCIANATAEAIGDTDLGGVAVSEKMHNRFETASAAGGSCEPEVSFRRSRHVTLPEEYTEGAFASFLEVAPDAVVVTDRNGRIIRINAQAEKMFQFSRTELLGRKIEVLIPKRFRQRHVTLRANDDSARSQSPFSTASYGLRKDGEEFPVEVSLGLLPVENRVLVSSAIRDVTDQRRLEDELRDHKQQLEDANRHKDNFLGMLAHELRNPLAAISMAVEVLRLSPPNADPEQLWDIISRQTEQMLHLVNDLMDVSRIAHGKVNIRKAPVELGPLISQAIEAVQPQLHTHKLQLTVTLPPTPVKLLADPVRLIEVFTNLLNNAAKYTDEGGQIALIMVEENDEVVVQLRDTGIGITAEMLPRIFDPFTQTTDALSRSEGGIGIGLAMVANFVHLHGGTLQAYSDGLGRGSRFVVRLPLLRSLDTGDDAAGRPGHLPAKSGSRCIVEMSDE